MSDEPKCEKCGLEITTGMMPALCQYARQCPMWPHSNGDKELMGGELFMAHAWMDNACEQIGLQIDERKRIAAYAEELRGAAEGASLAWRNWLAGCAHETRWKEVEAAHIKLRDALAKKNPSAAANAPEAGNAEGQGNQQGSVAVLTSGVGAGGAGTRS